MNQNQKREKRREEKILLHFNANANGKTLPNWFWLLFLYPVKRSKGKISPFHKEYVRMKAGRFARLGTRLSAHEQLRACVKWDLAVRDFSYFPTLCANISASGQ